MQTKKINCFLLEKNCEYIDEKFGGTVRKNFDTVKGSKKWWFLKGFGGGESWRGCEMEIFGN